LLARRHGQLPKEALAMSAGDGIVNLRGAPASAPPRANAARATAAAPPT